MEGTAHPDILFDLLRSNICDRTVSGRRYMVTECNSRLWSLAPISILGDYSGTVADECLWR